MMFNIYDETGHRKSCREFLGQFLSLMASIPNDRHHLVSEGSWLVLDEQMKIVNRKITDLNLKRQQLQREIPFPHYLLKRPFHARVKHLLSAMALGGMEMMSLGNGAYFAQQALGEDKIWGPIALASPILVAPFILKYFLDQFDHARQRINKVLFLIFGIAMLGFCWQFGNKFAVIDNSQNSFQVDWSGHSTETAAGHPVSYSTYLGCQLIIELLASLVFATSMAKFSGPQLHPMVEKANKEISRIDSQIDKLESERGILIFHVHRLCDPNAQRRPL